MQSQCPYRVLSHYSRPASPLWVSSAGGGGTRGGPAPSASRAQPRPAGRSRFGRNKFLKLAALGAPTHWVGFAAFAGIRHAARRIAPGDDGPQVGQGNIWAVLFNQHGPAQPPSPAALFARELDPSKQNCARLREPFGIPRPYSAAKTDGGSADEAKASLRPDGRRLRLSSLCACITACGEMKS
jgi:hypothetical protein